MYGETVLANEYLNIDDISEYQKGYFLPTFGPCSIDMYTEPNNLRIKEGPIDEDLNYDLNVLNEDIVDGHCLQLNKSEKNYSPRSYIPVSGSKPGGGSYVARLFMGVTSIAVDNKNTKIEVLEKKDVLILNNKIGFHQADENFMAFVMISEATAIEPRLTEPVTFRLCLGKLNFI